MTNPAPLTPARLAALTVPTTVYPTLAYYRLFDPGFIAADLTPATLYPLGTFDTADFEAPANAPVVAALFDDVLNPLTASDLALISTVRLA